MRITNTLLLVCAVLGLGACSPTEDSDNQLPSSKVTLSGTVATGDAFNGLVEIIDALGIVTSDVPIDGSGRFTASVDNNPPFLLQAEGAGNNVGQTLFSTIAAAGVVNITQLTTLALRHLSSADLEVVFSNWTTALDQFSSADIERAVARVNANLQSVYAAHSAELDATTYDFFSQPFDVGDALDGILDDLQITYGAGGEITVNTVSGGELPFNPEIDIEAFLAGGVSTGVCTITTVESGAVCVVGFPDSTCQQLSALAQQAGNGASAAFSSDCPAGSNAINFNEFVNPFI